MAGNYSYPIHDGWNDHEIATVINFLRTVEDAYEVGINPQKVLAAYRDFKKIVNSKAEEKTVGREFAAASGYQLYEVIKAARSTTGKRLKLKRR